MDESIDTFMTITGCSSVDTARFFLDSAGNDVEQAVNNFLEHGGESAEQQSQMQESEAVIGDAGSSDQPATNVVAQEGPGDDEQRWFTGGGGGGSGQEVIAPGAAPSGQNAMQSFMDAIQPQARQGTSDDLAPDAKVFTGSARTLSGKVSKPARGTKKVVVKFYDNGIFTVDDGPPRNIDDPASIAFLQAIRRQECPEELRDGSAEVQVSIMQTHSEYEASEQPRQMFVGAGHRLGSDGASTSAAAAPAPPTTVWSGPDESKPTTSVQIRMADGSRLVGRFNHDQTVADIRAFVHAARPGEKQLGAMVSGFPQKRLEDESQTIKDAGLINAVVMFK